jgi:6-phosphogluconate dehydrogenase
MRFAVVGLGEMGGGLAQQALKKGHIVVGYDKDPARIELLAEAGLIPSNDLDHLVTKMEMPRIVFLYLPHGQPLDDTIQALKCTLSEGDIVVDGGNSYWGDSIRHYEALKASGIAFLDAGTSGGIEGAHDGACFMVGGDAEVYAKVEPLFRDLAVPEGAVYAGPSGSGHFVKLVHNAIEFGMVQAIAEGLDLLTRWEHPLDLPALFHNWNHGSVIRSWLVDLMERALREEDLAKLSGFVEDTREVRWVLEYALQNEVWAPVIAQSELAFYRYRNPESTAGKAVALLRHMYGGHPLHRKDGGQG